MGFSPTWLSSQGIKGTSCGGPGERVVIGVVDYEDIRLSARSRGVFLTTDGRVFCNWVTADGGHFIFRGVLQGSYELHLASLGAYPPDPIQVRVTGRDTD